MRRLMFLVATIHVRLRYARHLFYCLSYTRALSGRLSLNLARARIGHAMKKDIHVFDFIVDLRQQLVHKSMKQPRKGKIQEMLTTIFEHVAVLYEGSRNDKAWEELGHLHLGVLCGKTGRARRIPGQYKRQVQNTVASRPSTRKATQVVDAMDIASDKTPVKRRRTSSETTSSPASASSPYVKQASKSSARTFNGFEMWNLYLECRTIAFVCAACASITMLEAVARNDSNSGRGMPYKRCSTLCKPQYLQDDFPADAPFRCSARWRRDEFPQDFNGRCDRR